MNDILKRLKMPAIGLIITGVLSGVLGILSVLSGLARLAGFIGTEPRMRDDAEKLGYYVGTGFGYGVGVLSGAATARRRSG
jgi:heme A synthase